MSAAPLQWMVEEEHTEQGVGVDLNISPDQWKKVCGVQEEGQDQTVKRTERWWCKEDHFLSTCKECLVLPLRLDLLVIVILSQELHFAQVIAFCTTYIAIMHNNH